MGNSYIIGTAFGSPCERVALQIVTNVTTIVHRYSRETYLLQVHLENFRYSSLIIMACGYT